MRLDELTQILKDLGKENMNKNRNKKSNNKELGGKPDPVVINPPHNTINLSR